MKIFHLQDEGWRQGIFHLGMKYLSPSSQDGMKNVPMSKKQVNVKLFRNHRSVLTPFIVPYRKLMQTFVPKNTFFSKNCYFRLLGKDMQSRTFRFIPVLAFLLWWKRKSWKWKGTSARFYPDIYSLLGALYTISDISVRLVNPFRWYIGIS